MRARGSQAVLFLAGVLVGSVVALGWRGRPVEQPAAAQAPAKDTAAARFSISASATKDAIGDFIVDSQTGDVFYTSGGKPEYVGRAEKK